MNRPLRLGLTGPIGCGKSTISGWLAARPGIVTVDADDVAREVLAAGTPQVEAVYERFGEALRRRDGTLDRAGLGALVFDDPPALAALEAIVHPAVRPRILAAIERAESDGADAVIVEAIKLVEGGLATLCDEVWLVTCDRATSLARTVGRGASEDDARRRIDAQADLTDRLRPHATRVVDTSTSMDETRAVVDDALEDALARHAAAARPT
ncbi:MAG TPA: dephospho-CoA kinase [Candidatus Saccharimonadales bacterium]|nr:dephospho-CoA kinase [Candidatus Saccharimonadales bacterium]